MLRKIWIIVEREYKASVRTKGFIIGLILAPIFMGGGLIAFSLFRDRVDTTDKKFVVVDYTGVIAPALTEALEYRNKHEIFDEKSGEKIKPAYHMEVVEPADTKKKNEQEVELSNRVRRNEFHSFLVVGPGVIHPTDNPEDAYIEYHARNAAMDDLRRWLNWPINNHLRKVRLADAGIDETEVSDLFHWVGVEGLGLVTMDAATGQVQGAKKANEAEAILVPIVLMMLMMLMMMMSVPGMLQSVMEEKTQRIAEVLLGSITPFQFMMGKVIGGIAVSLTSSAVYLIGGAFVVRYLGFDDYVPFEVFPWFVAYMLLAIIMFGSIAAAFGSTCSEAKDAQSLTFPVMIPMLFPMFVYFMVVKEPMSTFSTWISLIPPFTPMLMLLRQATPSGVPLWQPIVGLAGVLLFALLMVWLSGRVFRVAILMQGTPPKFSNMIKWALKG